MATTSSTSPSSCADRTRRLIERSGPGARVVFTDRYGGVSAAPYDELNLGDHVGDALEAVAENRRRAARSIGGVPQDPRSWVWLRQVHGRAVAHVDTPVPEPPEADAAVTARTDLPLVV